MKKIDEEELKIIKGGISAWGILGFSALAAFFVGIIDGIARPLKCHS